MQLQSGALLERGKYRIISSLGRGGFGVTYLAEQVMAKRKVCIKEFFPKDYYTREGDTSQLTLASAGFAEMMNKYKAKFIKEAQTIAALEHHNIIHIFDVFEENGTAYYVMEYIEGESLSSLVKREGALSEAVAVEFIRQAAAALDYIHHRQIMHLDIKPGNIMVRKDDDRAILIDFGLSKHYDEKSGEATSTTPVGVSHGYAPLEQYKQGGVKEFSPETDIYSLGATLYYLVAGTVPPDAADVADDGLPALPAHLSESTRSAIEHAMADKRKERPHSIKEFMVLLGKDKRVVVPAPAPIVEETVVSMPQPAEAEKTVIVASAPAQPKETSPRVEQQKPKAPKAETPKKKSKWWLWLIVAAIILAGAFLFGGGDNGDKAKNTESARIEQLRQDSIARAQRTQDSIKQAEHEKHIQDSMAHAKKQTDEKRINDIVAQSGESEEEEETTGPYKVGDYYNENGKEGVVFEVWDDGRHGKIVSLNVAYLKWCTASQFDKEIVVGASSESDGEANTDKVMRRSDKNQYPAFTWCRAKGTDWYLPAKNELMTIYNNKSEINSTLELYGDAITTVLYLSSTEKSGISAWFVDMHDGNTTFIFKDYYNLYVRAVSAF